VDKCLKNVDNVWISSQFLWKNALFLWKIYVRIMYFFVLLSTKFFKNVEKFLVIHRVVDSFCGKNFLSNFVPNFNFHTLFHSLSTKNRGLSTKKLIKCG